MFGAETNFDAADTGSKRPSAPLASHQAFAPLLIGWAALLFGLAVFVVAIAYSSEFWLPAALSAFAAIIGAYCGYRIAVSAGAKMPKFRRNPRKSSADDEDIAEDVTGRRAAAFISTDELGSSSLDAPLDLDISDALYSGEDADEQLAEDSDFADSTTLNHDPVIDEVVEHDFGENNLPSNDPYYEDPFAEDGFDGPASPNDRHRTDALGRKRYSFKESGLIADTSDALGQAAPDAPIDDSEPNANAPEINPPLVLEAPEFADEYEFSGGGSDEAFQVPQDDDGDQIDEYELGVTEADAPLHQAQIIDLKDRDLKDLSLVQMVDRFAVGLDGHRKARANDPASRAIRPSDPRIAQAIRDLPISELRPVGSSSTRAEAEQTEAALREALEKLQRMSDPG